MKHWVHGECTFIGICKRQPRLGRNRRCPETFRSRVNGSYAGWFVDCIQVRSTWLFCLVQQRLPGDQHCRQVSRPRAKFRRTVFLENHLVKGMAVRGMFIGVMIGTMLCIGVMIVLPGVAVFERTIAGNGTEEDFGMMMMRYQVMAQ